MTSYQIKDFNVSYSELTCPYHNLAIENNLILGNFKGPSHLFFYRNRPSIVMGRFQVPWREVNMPHFLARESTLNLVRRRSGGGTVYHDLGNWNFCFIHKKRDLSRKQNLELMIDLLASVGIQVRANERYDLVYTDDLREKVFKVSGSAFKQKKDTCLHHGTLLMDASLKSLRGSLGLPEKWVFEGKGVHSVSSPVINLAEVSRPLEFSQWIKKVQSFFASNDQLIKKWTHEDFTKEMIQEKNELSSWPWKWGETPHFKVEVPISDSGDWLLLEFLKGRCVTAKYRNATSCETTLSPLVGACVAQPLNEAIWQQLQEELIELSDLFKGALSYFFF